VLKLVRMRLSKRTLVVTRYAFCSSPVVNKQQTRPYKFGTVLPIYITSKAVSI